MKENEFNLGLIDVPLSWFDKVIEWLLISLLAFSPLAFGVVEAWSEEVVVILAAAISICFLLKLVSVRNIRPIWSWTYIPIALFILIAVFQIIPMPAGAVSAISPSTAATKKELLADLPNSDSLLKYMTLSFYPNATKNNLLLVLAVVAVFFVVINVYRQPDQIKRLLAAIAIIGGSLAVIALAQDLFGNGKIYWFVPTVSGEAYSGTFINRSHYGQFMNLSIGAALGLIMVKIHEAFTGKRVTPPAVFEYLNSQVAKPVWFLLAMIVIGAATVFVSLSRGGIVSMLMAAGFTTLVLSWRRSLRGRGWIMVLMALGAFICVLYIGFDAVYDRLAALQQLNGYKGRGQIIKDIAVAWTKFPVLGTGLGTHEVVYPMFDRSTIPALAAHAENEYAQAAEETGIIGLAALVAFGILVWKSYVVNVRSPYRPIRSAAYGLGFGLLAIMIHSLSDFGQHLPANALLSVIFCALLLSLVRIGQKNNLNAKVTRSSQGSRGLRIAVLACMSGVWAWILLGANSARLAEARWKNVLAIEQSLFNDAWQATDEEYADLISNAVAAADYQPDNVKYQHWLNVYRWRSISRTTDPNTGEVIIPDQAVRFVRRIVDELHNTRLLCPTYGATYCVVGQLETYVLDDPKGADNIRKGFQLAPCDPTTCFVAGFLDAEEQQIDASSEKFSRAVELDDNFFKSVVDVYINHVSRPDLAVAIAEDDIGRLSHVANALADMEEDTDTTEKAIVRIVELMREKCSKPDAPAWAIASFANICRSQKDNEDAIEHYRRALALDYGQVKWRFALARLLADTDRISEAVHEARICLRIRPQFKAAERLIADLSALPGAENEENQVPQAP